MPRPRKIDQMRYPEPAPLCDDDVVHVHAVRAARLRLPGVELLAGMSDLFTALADPTRLRIVAALAARELCVCDLSAAVGLSRSAASHHLRMLRDLGLVRARRDGRLVFYALDDGHVALLFEQARDHVGHRAEACG